MSFKFSLHVCWS
ncbi:hypothetical protein CP8484711_2113A, partial [Chlamydia psittaci 84-8471/1]